MRLYVAIDLPGPIREHLRVIQSDVARRLAKWPNQLRWVPADKLHLTLKFLGESIDDPAGLIASLRGVPTHGPFSLYTSFLAYFPSDHAPRIVSVNVAGDLDPLTRLADSIDSIAESHGVPRERRRFHPHITLARSRSRIPIKMIPPAVGLSDDFPIDHFTLYQSQLNPGGPAYRALATFPL